MYCRNCGNELPEGANFCPACGTGNDVEVVAEAQATEPVEAVTDDTAFEDAISAEVYTPEVKEEDNTEKDAKAGNILTFGILSVIFAEFGIVGLIMAIIARRKVAEFVEQYGETSGRATVGKHLSTGGYIASIVMTVFWGIYTVLLGVAVILSLFGI